MKRFWFLFVIVVLIVSGPVQATSVQRLSLDELVAKASTIVEADIVAARTYRTPDGKLILTSYTATVQENMKGAPVSSITVTTVGGRIGSTVLHVSGMPVFQPGDKAILFLEKSGAYSTIVGLNQGKFSILNGEVANDLAGLSFPDGQTGKQVRMPLNEFKRQLKLRLSR